jgi:hypothetical protein
MPTKNRGIKEQYLQYTVYSTMTLLDLYFSRGSFMRPDMWALCVYNMKMRGQTQIFYVQQTYWKYKELEYNLKYSLESLGLSLV